MKQHLDPALRARAWIALSVLAAVTSGAVAQDAAVRSPFSAATLWSLQRLGAPELSPDGRLAVLPVTRYDIEKDSSETDLWLVPTSPGPARRLTSHASGDSQAAWSPDGAWIAFVSRREGDTEPQLYVISPHGGEARRVTKLPTGAYAPRWFPDSKRLLFASDVWRDLERWDDVEKRVKERKESKVSAKVWDKAPIRSWDHWLDDREPHLFLADVGPILADDGGAEEKVEAQPVTRGCGRHLPKTGAGAGTFAVSPDGKELAFVADSDPSGVEPNGDVYVLALGSREPRCLTSDNAAADYAPAYSPDGRWLAFLRQRVRGFYGDRARLVLHDRQSGRTLEVTESWDRSLGQIHWAPDSQSVFSDVEDAGVQRLFRIALLGGDPVPLTRDRSFSDLAVSNDGAFLVALRQGFSEPPALVRVDLSGLAVTKLSIFNDAILSRVDLGEYESVSYSGARGDRVQMWVCYPPHFDRSRRWPLYLLLHGGPHSGIQDSFHWRWSAQVFASWGYVTAWHNFHGSSGFGQAFCDSINPDWATLPYEDTLRAAEYFASKDWIDPERLAAGGGSYGGYLATVLLGRDHPFKTLVAHAAVYNLYTQHASDYGASRRRFGEYWESGEILRRISPHYAAGSFKTPTLVIHGGLDFRVPLNHGVELFQTLQNRGVRSRLVYYPDENHWVLKPQNSIHWYDATRAWIEEHIGAGPTGTRRL